MITSPKKATRTQTKIHNQRLILKTIYDQRLISRADIARATHLTPATVSTLVVDLIESGLVEETGQEETLKRGKPATLLRVADTSCQLIGVDLSRSLFQGAIVDLRGNVVHRLSVQVNEKTGDAALELVYELIDKLVKATEGSLLGIGLGVPGLVDTQGGIICDTVHLKWQDLPLPALLTARHNVPVYVVNDSHAAALGEYTFGQDRETSNLIMLRVGPGVSAGIVLNGQLHYGDDFGAGEIGHVRVVDNGDLCLCGNSGCLETVVSKRVLLEQARIIATNNPDSKLHQFVTVPENITNTPVVVRAFAAGDEDLQQVAAEMGRYLGIAVANLVGVLNVRRILVAGSMSCFSETLLEPMRQEMKQSALPKLADKTQINLSSLGGDIVIQGAAALLLSYELGLV